MRAEAAAAAADEARRGGGVKIGTNSTLGQAFCTSSGQSGALSPENKTTRLVRFVSVSRTMEEV